MPNLFQALKPNEIVKLETHLLKHKTDMSFDLVGLDGFLTGILCIPEIVNPSEWLEMALSPEAVGEDLDGANKILELVFRYYNSIARPSSKDEPFAPCCDGSLEQCLTWMNGFSRAFFFDEEALEFLLDSEDDREQQLGILLIAHSVSISEMQKSDLDPELVQEYEQAYLYSVNNFEVSEPEENKTALKNIAFLVRKLFKPLKQNKLKNPFHNNTIGGSGFQGTVRRDTPKVGRNEPCPCGSGKKYKHCHGA